MRLATALTSTVDAIGANLEQQAAEARKSLQLQARISAELSRQQQAVAELSLLAEALAANASTYTAATVSSLYPMLERGAARSEIMVSLDRLIEVDVDRMERMSELQLVCFRLKTRLDLIEGLQDSPAVAELARDFSADLEVLARRLQDFRDPTRKAKAELWQQPQQFEADKQAFLQASDALLAAAQSKDQARIQPAYDAVHDSCKACHDRFKAR